MRYILLSLHLTLVASYWLEDRFPLCREACAEVIPQLNEEKLENAVNLDELNEKDSANRIKCMRYCLVEKRTGNALSLRLKRLSYEEFNYTEMDEDY